MNSLSLNNPEYEAVISVDNFGVEVREATFEEFDRRKISTNESRYTNFERRGFVNEVDKLINEVSAKQFS